MRKHWELLREAPLNNNCPECYNQDLSLRFRQKHLKGRLLNRITGDVVEELQCNTCNTRIYPVQWTGDIERSVAYYRKMVTPRRSVVRLTSLSYVLLLLGISLVGVFVYIWLNGAFRT